MVHFRFGRNRLPDTCESALTCYNAAKPPETFTNVQKRTPFPLDVQVEIIEINKTIFQ